MSHLMLLVSETLSSRVVFFKILMQELNSLLVVSNNAMAIHQEVCVVLMMIWLINLFTYRRHIRCIESVRDNSCANPVAGRKSQCNKKIGEGSYWTAKEWVSKSSRWVNFLRFFLWFRRAVLGSIVYSLLMYSVAAGFVCCWNKKENTS